MKKVIFMEFILTGFISIVFISMLLLILPSVSAECDLDYTTLEKYYETSAQENFSEYIKLIDTNYVYDYLADAQAYEEYVTAAWDVYDTNNYELKMHKCNDLPTGSIIFFNLKTELSSEDETHKLERDYVAVFETGKIQFVMDLELFSLHQNMVYYLEYYNFSKDIVLEELNKAEEVLIYAEENKDVYKNSSSIWLFIALLIILGGIIYYFRNKLIFLFKNKSKHIKKVKEKIMHRLKK